MEFKLHTSLNTLSSVLSQKGRLPHIDVNHVITTTMLHTSLICALVFQEQHSTLLAIGCCQQCHQIFLYERVDLFSY